MATESSQSDVPSVAGNSSTGSFLNDVGNIFNSGTALVSDALDKVSSAASSTWSAITDPVGTAVAAATNSLNGGVSSVGKSILQFAQQAQSKEYCWSCKIYGSLYDGLFKIIESMYVTIVEKTPALMTLSAIILMIVLCFKLLKIVASPFQENLSAEWVGVYTYLLRIAVIYPMFLTSALLAGVKDTGEFSPVSDLFINGPLAIGTELGTQMAKASCSLGQASLNILPVCQDVSGSSSGSDISSQHKDRAINLLWTFHKIGVTGISGGIWVATQVPSAGQPNIISSLMYFFGGFVLASIYFWLTITFGFRFVDALIRLMIVGSMIPIFVFLWIFDRTRSISHKALNQILFAGTAFAVSGVIVTVCAYIMVVGFAQAFPSGGNMFDSNFWMNQDTKNFSWMAFFYIVGCALIVSNLTKAIFSIASELVQTQGNMTQMGDQLDNQTHSAKNMVRSTAMRSVGM